MAFENISLRVLLFPPVSNYRRFLIHKCAEKYLDDGISTFSIGVGDERRTVVCFKSQLLRDAACGEVMGIDSTGQQRHYSSADQHAGGEACSENGGDGLYQPPHSRRRNKTQQIQEKIRNAPAKPRRPDRAVYVPRARRSANGNAGSEHSPAETLKLHTGTANDSFEPSLSAHLTQLEDSSTKKPDKPPTTPKKSLGKKFCNVYTPPHARHGGRIDAGECAQPCSRSSSFDHNDSDHAHVDAALVPSQVVNSNIVPNVTEGDCAICVSDNRIVDNELTAGSNDRVSDYVSRHRSDSVNNILDDESSDIVDLCKFDNIDSGLGVSGDSADEYKGVTEDFDDSQSYGSFLTNNDSNIDRMDIDSWHETNTNEINRISMAVPNLDENSVIINANHSIGYNTSKDEDVEEKELERVSQEINRTSRRIIKQSFTSNVLVISDPVASSDNVEKKIKTEVEEEDEEDVVNNCAKPKLEAKASVKREESDWDSVFDDSGECLDPSLLEELTATVGKVQICKTKNSYEPYQSKRQSMLSGPYDETFAHVLEVYSFPAEFKTNDLLSVFSDYKDTGFEIKWVDDNHALMVFSSSKIAADVLASSHPMVKTRPLHEATHESRQKAKKSAEFLQPYRQRPETCTALARRLVSGALGVKLSTARQERAEERRLIHNAREKKRQAALHKEAAWDGSLTSQNVDVDGS